MIRISWYESNKDFENKIITSVICRTEETFYILEALEICENHKKKR